MKTTIVRKFFAVLTACGAGVSVFLYIESLHGVTFDDRVEWVLPLAAIALSAPIVLVEYRSVKTRTFWKDSRRATPGWARWAVNLAWLIALGHLIRFAVNSHLAAPTMLNGQFVLDDHGRIVKVISESEYWVLKAEELRVFFSLMVAVYLNSTIAWWFPTTRRRAATA